MKRKKALITGASRGIGKAIAYSLAAEGFDLYLTCSKSENALLYIKKEIEALYSINCVTFVGDMGQYQHVAALFKQIDDLEILVNNAGISYIGLLSEMSHTEWEHIISTNLSSAFYCSKLAIPFMLSKKRGKIINISSVWGNTGAAMEVAYSASKGGINAFTKSLSKELATSNIQVNAIACGAIDTKMNEQLSADELQNLINEIPADRLGRPEEVAGLVVMLIHSGAYLTGQVIALDGGWI